MAYMNKAHARLIQCFLEFVIAAHVNFSISKQKIYAKPALERDANIFPASTYFAIQFATPIPHVTLENTTIKV